MVILDQRVQARMIHLTIDYAQLGAETVELRRLVMEMKPHMSGTCSPLLAPRSRRRPASSSFSGISFLD
jgi:hypothetical protein